ncbi:MAG: hypothetical protein ABWY06_17005 [Pseudomonas sp.]|uniref:hypothetical protein n=1 Tax=Pseudomonas sp. TaxID=306 RepID=UPI0033975A03
MRIRHIAIAASLLTLLSACAGFQPKTDVEVVKALSQQRMDALVAQDMEEAYSLMSPGYRASNNLERFKRTVGVGAARLNSADARTVSCEEDACKVLVYANYYFPDSKMTELKDAPTFERVNEEKWIRLDGKWWFFSLK